MGRVAVDRAEIRGGRVVGYLATPGVSAAVHPAVVAVVLRAVVLRAVALPRGVVRLLAVVGSVRHNKKNAAKQHEMFEKPLIAGGGSTGLGIEPGLPPPAIRGFQSARIGIGGKSKSIPVNHHQNGCVAETPRW